MAAVAGRQTPALALTGSEETGVETSWRRPGRHLRGSPARCRHEDGDIILAVVIICALAGLAWLARWWWRRILVRAFDRGYSLGFLRGCTQRLGGRTGCNLEDYGGLQDFMGMYEERVANSELPESPELRRTVFRPDPEGTPRMHERLCERLRAAATAMWYVMGTMGHGDAGRS